MGTTPNRLKQLREHQELSGSDLGEKVGRTRATIHNWETGATPIPDWAKEALSSIFGVSIAHLMGWEDREAA